jgi:two-component SAPR family response regulator
MNSQPYSLRDALNSLRLNRDNFESKIGRDQVEKLLFNLEEISLDIENVAAQIREISSQEASLDKLTKVFDDFQYGSIPHIIGHLETIETLLECQSQEPKNESEVVLQF